MRRRAALGREKGIGMGVRVRFTGSTTERREVGLLHRRQGMLPESCGQIRSQR